MGVRTAFFVALAVGTVGLGAAPVLGAYGPAAIMAGCGPGYYENSDEQCILDPRAGGLPANGAPGLVIAPGLVGAPGIAGGGPGGPPPGATAVCRDGDYSYSTHHSGTCSGHGGVREWLSN